MFSQEELEKALEKAWNLGEVAEALGYKKNPSGSTKKRIKEALDAAGLSTEHLKTTARPKYAYERICKTCPVCKKEFETLKEHSREKMVCSRGCANSYFRSGVNNPNYKNGSGTNYRFRAFLHKEKKCEKCGWSEYPEILEVHHRDRDRSNNDLENLEVLCPTCHEIEHFLNKDGKWLLEKAR